jgi:hypothetical protein
MPLKHFFALIGCSLAAAAVTLRGGDLGDRSPDRRAQSSVR